MADTAPSIAEWQARSAEWTDSRFPDDNLLMRGLILGEETGEILAAAVDVTVQAAKVQRCILKAEQDIRGGTEHWMGELRKETVDGFFCLVALAHRAGFSLSDAIEECWAALQVKTYTQGESEVEAEASTQRPPEDRTGCVVSRCEYRAEVDSSYCAKHGVAWGRPDDIPISGKDAHA